MLPGLDQIIVHHPAISRKGYLLFLASIHHRREVSRTKTPAQFLITSRLSKSFASSCGLTTHPAKSESQPSQDLRKTNRNLMVGLLRCLPRREVSLSLYWVQKRVRIFVSSFPKTAICRRPQNEVHWKLNRFYEDGILLLILGASDDGCAAPLLAVVPVVAMASNRNVSASCVGPEDSYGCTIKVYLRLSTAFSLSPESIWPAWWAVSRFVMIALP